MKRSERGAPEIIKRSNHSIFAAFTASAFLGAVNDLGAAPLCEFQLLGENDACFDVGKRENAAAAVA